MGRVELGLALGKVDRQGGKETKRSPEAVLWRHDNVAGE
jgi:hypothetical protein